MRSVDRRAFAALVALTALFGLLVVEYTLQFSGDLRHALNVGVYNNVMLAAGVVCVVRGLAHRRERTAWIAMGAAVLAWGIGNTVWTFTVANLPDPPYPSYADIGFLAVYPFAYVAIVLLVRSRMGHLRASLWLDGVIGSLAIGALGVAVVFEAVLKSTGGSRAAVATNLAYPLLDVTLVCLVVWALAVTGWRPGRRWSLIVAGLLVFSLSDCVYLYQTAVGSYVNGSPTDLGWVAGGVLLAWAAWMPDEGRAAEVSKGWPLLATPVAFGLLALGLLVYDHFSRLHPLALVLAGLAIVAVLVRLALTFGENMAMLERTRHEANTDELTGLGNRRRLMRELERRLETGPGAVLALFDLNGFKQYNDEFGHQAGDALLKRLGDELAASVAGRGSAYRIGGDEFCVVLANDGGVPELVVAGAKRALRESGGGFAITASFGLAVLPDEAGTVADALRLVDQRMYAQKQSGRISAGEQSSSVLLTAIAEGHPTLGEHLADVGDLAEALARRLGLTEPEVARTRLAAELHDIGKIAIPDAILGKAGPLSVEDWSFIRRHTLIGERILAAAPALAQVAGIVRSTHEHWDGSGYPDGLAGEAIPLPARIVLVCDAFDAMTSPRPYRSALPAEHAIAELVRCAGAQFDPAIVAHFAALVAVRAAELVPAAAAVG
jgi:diguanylate cyclase (GGDEF)-like protein